jgi:cytochrome b pre-mRNA-processing protein 3|tara:strand:- start:3317 stop:3703 length:387 start_codon:yes stop_codon:yes gene_type:complete
MFIHFSIMMIIFKKKGKKFDQKSYDSLFFNIENNLRELGYGDVAVNKKMKDLNKILYDILLKINNVENDSFKLNKSLIIKYFNQLNDKDSQKYEDFERYLNDFYKFCFELSLENMIREAVKFKDYGCT